MIWKNLISLGLLVLSATSVLATSSTGCGKTPTLKTGNQANIQINGKSRQWIMHLPSNYDKSRPYRLIFGLHWRDGHYTDVESGKFYNLEPLANNSAIFVAPNGLNSGWANSGGEDVTFIKSLITLVEENLCVDQSLRYSVGWSYGGAMSYSLACSLGSELRAIAVLSGALLSGCSGATMPVAYYGQHGVNDNVLPLSSGKSIRDTFVKLNGCTSQTTKDPSSGSKTHIKTQYAGCKTGYPLTWIAFDGPHEPLAKDGNSASFTPGEVWTFFSQFS